MNTSDNFSAFTSPQIDIFGQEQQDLCFTSSYDFPLSSPHEDAPLPFEQLVKSDFTNMDPWQDEIIQEVELHENEQWASSLQNLIPDELNLPAIGQEEDSPGT